MTPDERKLLLMIAGWLQYVGPPAPGTGANRVLTELIKKVREAK
jgi:hypothetical protein